MEGFRARLGAAIERSRYKGKVWQLSEDAQLGRKTVYNILNDSKLDTSKTGPGFFAISRIAELIEISLDELAGKAPEPLVTHTVAALTQQMADLVERTNVDSLMRLHAKSGGRIEAFEKILPYCDVYAPCEAGDSNITVRVLGARSLATVTMGTSSVDVMQSAVDALPEGELRVRWVEDYSEATRRGVLATVETLNVQMPNRPVKVKMDFTRTLLCVLDGAGEKSVLNFSSLII